MNLINQREALFILEGLGNTFTLSLISYIGAIVFGAFLALTQYKTPRPLRAFFRGFTSLGKNTPELLILFFLYFGGSFILEEFFHIKNFSTFTSSFLALSWICGSYMCDIFIGSYQNIPKGEIEAAQCLNLKQKRIFIRIIFPQLLRKSLPSMGNIFPILLKDSCLVSLIGGEEFMKIMQVFASQKNAYFSFYLMAAVIYIVITVLAQQLFNLMEKKLNAHREVL